MIQANEIRIGDWVLFSEDGTKFIVEEVSRTGLGVTNQNETTWIEIDQFEPIPLTEEILLKCGFECIEKDNSGGDYRHRNYKWFQFFFNSKSILKYGAFTQLIHLHQLQNLYFALTGKELDIDLSR